MNFFRAFVAPSEITDISTFKQFRFGGGLTVPDANLFIEEVSIGSGLVDAPLHFDGKIPSIFVKRARMYLPNIDLAKGFSTSSFMAVPPVVTDVIQIWQKSNIATFPTNPLRIRSSGDKQFQINEWIDTNEFLKLDPLASKTAPQTYIALDTTLLSVDFGADLADMNTDGARFEIEFFSNMETFR